MQNKISFLIKAAGISFVSAIFFLSVVSPAKAAYPLGNEAVLYHFEDAATATSTNSGSTGATNNGTFVGGASTTASVFRFGARSGSFSETGDYMKTYFGSSTNPTLSSISVSLWVYKKEASSACAGADADHIFGSSGQPSGSRFYIRCTTAGKWGMRFGAAAAADSATDILHQTWQHIVAVFDAANDTPKLYVDNVLKATSATVSSYTITGDFFVGGVNDTITTPGVLNTGENANAYIDEVAIYNTALSLSDISALYKAGDGVAPVISSVATSSVDTSGITVTWTTDENASTQIQYGTTSSYGSTTTEIDTSTFVTSHTQSITGLSAGTTYHYRVVSRDPTSVLASSTDAVFTTTAAADVTPPIISSVASSTTATTATITWTTDEAASSTVRYGATTSYGSASTTAALTTPHTIILTGLTASTAYHFQVGSADAAANVATSSDLVFTTSAPPAPGQPGSLAATPYEGRMLLVWTASSGTLDDYKIEYKLSADSTWTTFVDGVSTATTTLVTSLTTGSSYDFRVSGLNGVSTSTVSSTVTATPLYRVAFVSPTPAQSSTVTTNYFTVSASSTLPSASYASSTQIIRLETAGGSLVSQVSTTTRYGDYNLTHLTNTLANSDLSLLDNSSGIAYVSTTDTLFIVHNRSTGSDSSIDEVDKNGTLIRSITCTLCGDTEGITLISSVASTTVGGYDHTFMISSENDTANAEIYRVVIHSTGTTAVNKNDYFDTGITHNANGGLEGIAYNPLNGKFFVARELTTPALFEVTLPGSGRTATSTPICGNLTWNAAVSDFSDLAFNNNILYVLSENTNPSKLVAVDVSSTSTCAYVDSDGDGDVSSSDTGDWLTSIAVGLLIKRRA